MDDDHYGDAVILTGDRLTPEDVLRVAERNARVEIPGPVEDRVRTLRRGLEDHLYLRPEKPVYGVNRGCGDLLREPALKNDQYEAYKHACEAHREEPDHPDRKRVFEEYMLALGDYQDRYIRAHNCGTGDPMPIPVVRAMMLIRLSSFVKGVSGVRLETCVHMQRMLNAGVTPWVLEEGSVGASGDLVPLAMMAASMMGMAGSQAYYKAELMESGDALEAAGLEPLRLYAKEAVGLTNGASFMAAHMVFSLRDAELLLKNAAIAAALYLEAIRGEPRAFSKFLASTRPHPGAVLAAGQMRRLIEGSGRMTEDAQKLVFPAQDRSTAIERVQDRYSFRAVPQIHGAAFEALSKLRSTLEIELGSATDNPLFEKGAEGIEVYSGANFHGQPLAAVVDYVKAALTALALISNKRTFSLLDKSQNFGLNSELAADSSGGDTGLMILQYAGAARAAESRVLSTPASVQSISTAANQEDFVSMGSVGVLHLRKIIYNTNHVLTAEVLCALRALQLSSPKRLQGAVTDKDGETIQDTSILGKLGKGTKKVYEYLDREFPKPEQDRYLRTDMERVSQLLQSGTLAELVDWYE